MNGKLSAINQITDLMRAASRGDTKAVLESLLKEKGAVNERAAFGRHGLDVRPRAKGTWKPYNSSSGTRLT